MLKSSQMFLNKPQYAVFSCPGVGYEADYLRLLLAPSYHLLGDSISPVSNKATRHLRAATAQPSAFTEKQAQQTAFHFRKQR